MGVWSSLWDFVRFRTLISSEVLIGFYWLGAVVMPGFAFWFWRWSRARYPLLRTGAAELGHWQQQFLSPRLRLALLLAAIAAFVLMELFWRMLFEFLIVYLHMAEDLQRLVGAKS
ncbi:DUF4282 domain-containing protein [Halothiobacillus sp. DCM-1]|uniref:DUF4282 domain-containing protein n=1 Tax=Halothiobacillus sp. DCM-1 TaxID=3112558 RepID=UPI003246F300